ncbi:MAG: hypothetical protein U0Z53_08630 [Blastocatellia bacterium]
MRNQISVWPQSVWRDLPKSRGSRNGPMADSARFWQIAQHFGPIADAARFWQIAQHFCDWRSRPAIRIPTRATAGKSRNTLATDQHWSGQIYPLLSIRISFIRVLFLNDWQRPYRISSEQQAAIF